MIAKLKKVLYTVDESNPDAEVVIQVAGEGSVQAWAIAQFRAACVIARGEHELIKTERAVPASLLRNAKSLGEVFAMDKTSGLPLGDWRVKALRSLDEAEKEAVAIARVGDLRRIEELYTQSLPVYDPYCELVIREGNIEYAARFAKAAIPAELTLPGRICLNPRYFVEAVQNLVARDTVGVAIARHNGVRILVLASQHERHYIAEMRKKK